MNTKSSVAFRILGAVAGLAVAGLEGATVKLDAPGQELLPGGVVVLTGSRAAVAVRAIEEDDPAESPGSVPARRSPALSLLQAVRAMTVDIDGGWGAMAIFAGAGIQALEFPRGVMAGNPGPYHTFLAESSTAVAFFPEDLGGGSRDPLAREDPEEVRLLLAKRDLGARSRFLFEDDDATDAAGAPEPSIALLAAGALGLLFRRRR